LDGDLKMLVVAHLNIEDDATQAAQASFRKNNFRKNSFRKNRIVSERIE
jgi:hypothetical protein